MRKLKNEELGRITPGEFKNSQKAPIVIVLDNVRSLNNIGSIFRTADAFRIEKIYLCGITGKPPHKDIHKTALGATESVDWEYFEDTIEAISKLQKKGYSVFALEQADNSTYLESFKPSDYKKIALVFGNEVKGVSDKIISMVEGCIEIPQFGTKHSFNIVVSAGIVLWELFRKKKIELET
jgi:tRNA G18 (ribose-2'-O)-methylase SpoU